MDKNSRILVADSDLQSVCLLEKVLSEAGFDFELVCSATETVETLSEEYFDLLILGQLGCVNEKISVEKLSEKLTDSRMSLLLILDDFLIEPKKVGFKNCDYLKKPFSKKNFLKKVFALLEN